MISERVKSALAVVKARGPRPGKKPIGRPPTMPAAVRRRILRERKAGKSLRAIAEALTRDGVPCGGARWYASTVRAALSST